MTEATLNSFFVLDVGHGTCAAIVQDTQAVLIDVGPGATLLQFLKDKGVKRVESVIISHADADHLGGLIGLLASQEVSVGTVYVNPDGVKGSNLWRDLAYVLDQLGQQGDVVPIAGLVQGDVPACSLAGWRLEVVAPRHRLAQLGVGNRDKRDQRITSNSMSVVLRVFHNDLALALCPGDLDHVGYTHLADYTEEMAPDLSAIALLAPHHGGYCGSVEETRAVISWLMSKVRPSRVLVSHGRRRHNNPLPVVVESVRGSEGLDARVQCTQMSSHCLAGSGDLLLPLVSPHASAGSESGNSCAGTTEITTTGQVPTDQEHQRMISTAAPHRLCRS